MLRDEEGELARFLDTMRFLGDKLGPVLFQFPYFRVKEMAVGDFVARLENELDTLNADLPALQEFILPGGGTAAAACHLARTIVRRAERITTTLADSDNVRPEALRYLNRLSDLLFVIARVLARAESGQEVLWDRQR